MGMSTTKGVDSRWLAGVNRSYHSSFLHIDLVRDFLDDICPHVDGVVPQRPKYKPDLVEACQVSDTLIDLEMFYDGFLPKFESYTKDYQAADGAFVSPALAELIASE
jgi:hypothetical protein